MLVIEDKKDKNESKNEVLEPLPGMMPNPLQQVEV